MLLSDKLMLGLMLWISMHILALVLYNRYRRAQLLHYLQICRHRELSEQEFSYLLNTYTSFLGFAMPSPSRSDYPKLYVNTDFDAFASRSKHILVYLVLAIVMGFVLASVLDSTQQG
jgi:hypothetical protein